MLKKITINQPLFLGICGFVALFSGTVLNLIFGADFPGSIVPFVEIVTPIVNGFCAFLCVIFIFFPKKQKILITILAIQSIYDVLTGFELLGLFLFLLLILILFCKGFFKTYLFRKLGILFGVWFLVLLSLISFGLERFLFAAVVTIFMVSAFVYIHYLLIDKLSYLMPQIDSATIDISNGTVLNLSQLGFSERQIQCILSYQGQLPTYKELANKLYTSESTIKLEMTRIYKKIGVKNREELKLLLSRYELVL